MNICLIAEGASDLAVIDNIIYAYCDEEFDSHHIQPIIDETTRKQVNHGGWNNVINHIKSARFYDDLNFSDVFIIQFDTDVSDLQGFDVSHRSATGETKTVEELITDVINRIVQLIKDSHGADIEHLINRLVFCICVHSMECWLVNLKNNRAALKNFVNCHRKLVQILKTEVVKSYPNYEQLSKPLTSRKDINELKNKDQSFRIFVESLEKVLI